MNIPLSNCSAFREACKDHDNAEIYRAGEVDDEQENNDETIN
jgi:hypothetical protein